jgi:hypothetical protein
MGAERHWREARTLRSRSRRSTSAAICESSEVIFDSDSLINSFISFFELLRVLAASSRKICLAEMGAAMLQKRGGIPQGGLLQQILAKSLLASLRVISDL